MHHRSTWRAWGAQRLKSTPPPGCNFAPKRIECPAAGRVPGLPGVFMPRLDLQVKARGRKALHLLGRLEGPKQKQLSAPMGW